MRSAKIVWISGSVSIAAIITIFLMSGASVRFSKNIVCGDVCESYFNVTPKYKTCFNITNLIQTEPHVVTDLFYKNGNSWRLAYGESFCIPAYTKTQFSVVGYKQRNQTVKWSANSLNIDPLWISDVNYETTSADKKISKYNGTVVIAKQTYNSYWYPRGHLKENLATINADFEVFDLIENKNYSILLTFDVDKYTSGQFNITTLDVNYLKSNVNLKNVKKFYSTDYKQVLRNITEGNETVELVENEYFNYQPLTATVAKTLIKNSFYADPNISACGLMNISGYYELNKSIEWTTGNACLTIMGKNVEFNGRGFNINGKTAGYAALYFSFASYSNATNLTINVSTSLTREIYIYNTNYSTLSNITMYNPYAASTTAIALIYSYWNYIHDIYINTSSSTINPMTTGNNTFGNITIDRTSGYFILDTSTASDNHYINLHADTVYCPFSINSNNTYMENFYVGNWTNNVGAGIFGGNVIMKNITLVKNYVLSIYYAENFTLDGFWTNNSLSNPIRFYSGGKNIKVSNVYVGNSSQRFQFSSIRDLSIENLTATTNTYGMYFDTCKNVTLRNVYVNSSNVALDIYRTENITAYDSEFDNNVSKGCQIQRDKDFCGRVGNGIEDCTDITTTSLCAAISGCAWYTCVGTMVSDNCNQLVGTSSCDGNYPDANGCTYVPQLCQGSSYSCSGLGETDCNTYTSSGICNGWYSGGCNGGTLASCSGLDPAICTEFGCSVVGNCAGSLYDCSYITSESVCTMAMCWWDSGTSTCSGASSGEVCSQLSGDQNACENYVSGQCTFSNICDPNQWYPTPGCSGASSQSNCEGGSGYQCTWSSADCNSPWDTNCANVLSSDNCNIVSQAPFITQCSTWQSADCTGSIYSADCNQIPYTSDCDKVANCVIADNCNGTISGNCERVGDSTTCGETTDCTWTWNGVWFYNFTNVSYYNESFVTNTGGVEIFRRWYYQANVSNTTSPIVGAVIKISNTLNTLLYTLTTLSNGLTPKVPLLSYWRNTTKIIYYSNYSMNMTSNQQNVTRSYNITNNIIDLYLLGQEQDPCVWSQNLNWLIDCNDNCHFALTNMNRYNFTAVGPGTIYNLSNIYNYEVGIIKGSCIAFS